MAVGVQGRKEEYRSAAPWCVCGKGVCLGAHLSAQLYFLTRELHVIVV